MARLQWAPRAGADVVLGMIPLARELLRMGSEVVMVANSLPAINDVTCAELRTLLESLCEVCPVLKVIAADHPLFLAWSAQIPPCEVGQDHPCYAPKVMLLSMHRL